MEVLSFIILNSLSALGYYCSPLYSYRITGWKFVCSSVMTRSTHMYAIAKQRP